MTTKGDNKPMKEKKEENIFPRFKKRKLNREKITIKKEHKQVVAPPGQ